jgi:hypothetical protein
VIADATTGTSPIGDTLGGTANPNNVAATAYFRRGETTRYGQTTADQDMGSGATAVSFTQALSNLTCNTTYHYRAVCANGSDTIYREDRSFRTSACSGAMNISPIFDLMLSSE